MTAADEQRATPKKNAPASGSERRVQGNRCSLAGLSTQLMDGGAWRNDMTKALIWALDQLAIVAATDTKGAIIYANDLFCNISGYSRDELLGQDHRMLNSGLHPKSMFKEMYRTIANGGVWRGDLQNKAKDGSLYWVDTMIVPVRSPSDKVVGYISLRVDITERRNLSEELRAARDFLDAIIEHIPVSVFVKEAKGLRYVLVNGACERHHGVERRDMLGKTAHELFDARTADFMTAADLEVLRSRRGLYRDEHVVETAKRGKRVVTSKRLPIVDAAGEAKYIVGVVEDVTERRAAEDQIAYLAYHDSLTGLGNRSAFNKALKDATAGADADRGFALLYIDLDRFKEINDAYGHGAGDAFLKEVAARLRDTVGDALIYRLGGDEFAIIRSREAARTEVVALCARIQSGMAKPFQLQGHCFCAGLSIGVASFPHDGDDAQTLTIHADAALYVAKEQGRGTTRFFEAAMNLRLHERFDLVHDLRLAMTRGELELYYRPEFKANGEIEGLEALLHWRHPVRGVLPPERFMSLAEELGLIAQLGDWVLREACKEAAAWRKPLPISVNISPVQIRRGDLAELVHAILLQTGLPAGRLVIEVAESALLSDCSLTLLVLRRLRALGVRIAVADFGRSYAALSRLPSLPFDKVKIDPSLISSLCTPSRTTAIARPVTGLGHGLDLEMVGEGPENAEQLAFLAGQSCDRLHGFWSGRPLPIEEYAEIVGRERAPSRPILLEESAAG